MKKTPLQQLIEFMEQNQYFIGNDLYAKQKELLKKERVVIVDAYCCGDMDYNKVALPGTRAEEYFNETFEQ